MCKCAANVCGLGRHKTMLSTGVAIRSYRISPLHNFGIHTGTPVFGKAQKKDQICLQLEFPMCVAARNLNPAPLLQGTDQLPCCHCLEGFMLRSTCSSDSISDTRTP